MLSKFSTKKADSPPAFAYTDTHEARIHRKIEATMTPQDFFPIQSPRSSNQETSAATMQAGFPTASDPIIDTPNLFVLHDLFPVYVQVCTDIQVCHL